MNQAPITGQVAASTAATATPSRTRYWIILILFLVSTLNYGDRGILSITGSAIQGEFVLSPEQMGWIFSAFAWAYVLGQLPGGWLLDRYGSKRTYAVSIFCWSLLTSVQAFNGGSNVSLVVTAFFALRFLVGLAEAPAAPGNSRMVASWFPASERGTASSIFNSGQYSAIVLFAPVSGWLIHAYGWRSVYLMMGVLGFIMAWVWVRKVHSPLEHPRINQAELDYLREGGAVVDMDAHLGKQRKADGALKLPAILKGLLTSRMLVGIYIGHYCFSTITYFFTTWFPIYLVQERGMSILQAGFLASIPAICGFVGNLLGGLCSDGILRKTGSLNLARKVPIIVGLLASTSMIICNYVSLPWMVIAIMAFAFFGKGFASLGWAVMADTAPRQAGGVTAGLFNTFGNIGGITTPIIIGFIVQATGSFNMALVFVAGNALLAMFSYLVVVGPLRRLELTPAIPGKRENRDV
ncbi:glucarate transporter [Pseudomonas putida]|nr:glucarate transporter [Pseudomonas putida]